MVKRLLARFVWLVLAATGALCLGGIANHRGEAVNSLWLVVAAVCTFLVGYRLYGKFIASKVLYLDDRRATPAERLRDGHDFEPTNRWILFGVHFAAIAGPGPLVGPTLAAQFGYLPGTLWIILGAVLGGAAPPVHLTPATTDRELAADWFDRFEGAGLDGVVAKRLDGTYQPGKRAMVKVKHERTADCVVAGFRWHKNGPGTHIGSLLLGLFDDTGRLHHVGITSSFSWERRADLVAELAPLREEALEGHPWREWADWASFGDADASGQRMPGATSRWNRGKDLSWEPLRCERVAEVAYDHLQGERFRHATTFRRWRPDKPVEACRYDQLEATAPFELARIFGG